MRVIEEYLYTCRSKGEEIFFFFGGGVYIQMYDRSLDPCRMLSHAGAQKAAAFPRCSSVYFAGLVFSTGT